MRRWSLLLAVVGLACLGVSAGPARAAAAVDMDCPDFAFRQDAQDYFTAHGGSAVDNVDRLDADRDGIACELLPRRAAAAAATTRRAAYCSRHADRADIVPALSYWRKACGHLRPPVVPYEVMNGPAIASTSSRVRPGSSEAGKGASTPVMSLRYDECRASMPWIVSAAVSKSLLAM